MSFVVRPSIARVTTVIAASILTLVTDRAAAAQTPCTFGPSGVSGTPDCNFGGTGLVTTALPGGWGSGTRIVAQADGKLVVAGQGYPAIAPQGGGYDLYVVRYNADGSLDGSFGTGGVATVGVTPQLDYEYAYGVVLQNVAGETRILIAGAAPLKSGGNPQFGVALVRFTSSGQLDTSFGTNGRVQFGWSNKGDSWAYDVALQCNGRIVVAGKYGTDMGVARLTANGALDTSFAGTGKTIVSLGRAAAGDTIGGGYAVAFQPFGGLQPSGCPAEQRIIVVGNRATVNGTGTSRDMAAVRLLTNGSVDKSFGTAGFTFIDNARSVDYAWGVAIDAQNRVVLTGYANVGPSSAPPDFAAARLTPGGLLDETFGVGGKVTADIDGASTFSESGAVIDASGRILASGTTHTPGFSDYDFSVVRFNSDGAVDTTFGTGGLTRIDFGVGDASEGWGKLTLDPSGRIVVVGSTDAGKLVATAVLNP